VVGKIKQKEFFYFLYTKYLLNRFVIKQTPVKDLVLMMWRYVVTWTVSHVSTVGSIVWHKTWMRSKHRFDSLRYRQKWYSDGCMCKN